MKKVSLKKLQEGFSSFLAKKDEIPYQGSSERDNVEADNKKRIKKELIQYINSKILKNPIRLIYNDGNKQENDYNNIELLSVMYLDYNSIYGPSVQFISNRFGVESDELIIEINYEKNKVEMSPRSVDLDSYKVSREDLHKLHSIFMRINSKFEEDNRNGETIKLLNDKFKLYRLS